jgi:lysophospholipase L1-like esterase
MEVVAKPGVTTVDLYDCMKRLASDTSQGAAQQFRRSVVGAMILVGGNDLKLGSVFKEELFEGSLRRLMSLVRRNAPDAFVCMGTYPVPGPHPRLRRNSDEITRSKLNPTIRRIAHEFNAGLCELENLFQGRDDLRRDGVHPTIAGDKLMSDAWVSVVLPLLESRLRKEMDE